MSMNISFVPEKETLDLSFDGNLDLTMTRDICGIIRIIPKLQDSLKMCILDLTPIERVFDSGIALLRMLIRDVRLAGATVVVLGDHPDMRERLSLLHGAICYPSRRQHAAALS